jgi:hypothetical protein
MPANKPRNYDRESGMDRTSPPKRKGKKALPRYSVDTESEESFEDSGPEEFLDIQEKDSSRKKRPTRKPRNKRDFNVRPITHGDEADEEDLKETKKKEEPPAGQQFLFVQALAFRSGVNKITFPNPSTYVPDVNSLFTVLEKTAIIISSNSLLHERFPAYTSLGLFAFYSHAVFYHILRVREDAGELKRDERRALRKYQAIGAAESWEIAPQMVHFFQSLGKFTPEGGKYGIVLPRFPSYDNLASNTAAERGLHKLDSVRGIGRLPIVPAIHQYLHNFGEGTAKFDDTDDVLYPVKKTLGTGTDQFLGLTSSAADAANFQALAFSSGWNSPVETNVDTFMMNATQKRNLVKKWRIPSFGDQTNITDIEIFLGLDDTKHHAWIQNLLIISAEVNKFFPGAVSLANIPLTTRAEAVSHIDVTSLTQAAGKENNWFNNRVNWKLTLAGKYVREDSQPQYQAALSTMVRPTYSTHIAPAIIGDTLKDKNFTADTQFADYFRTVSAPADEVSCDDQPDPLDQAMSYIQLKMYDNLGGKKN